MSNSVTVVGIKETLRELNKIEPELRKEIIKDFRQVVKPVVNEVRQSLPSQPPLSGFGRSWKAGKIFPWDTGIVSKSIIPKIDTRKRGNALAVMKVIMRSAGGTVTDMAGKRGGSSPQGQRFISALFGSPSRVMWSAYESSETEVQRAMMELVEDAAKTVENRIVVIK